MLPQKVKSQTDALRRRLREQGWEVMEIEQPFEDEWWTAEFWLIESMWSPQGVQLCLTFLVDPMGRHNDISGVYASKRRPRQRPLDENPFLTLGHGWQKELPSFINSINSIRGCGPQEP